jgi:hypothetical protein
LTSVAAAAGIPFRTAQRWVSQYQQLGLTALARKKRTDTSEHRAVSAKLKEVGRDVAIKVSDERFSDRFEQEARVIAFWLAAFQFTAKQHLHLHPFAAETGEKNYPAWAPDGKTIAYFAEVGGVRQIFTKAVHHRDWCLFPVSGNHPHIGAVCPQPIHIGQSIGNTPLLNERPFPVHRHRRSS